MDWNPRLATCPGRYQYSLSSPEYLVVYLKSIATVAASVFAPAWSPLYNFAAARAPIAAVAKAVSPEAEAIALAAVKCAIANGA